LLAVETLAHEYLSAEQITDFLPALGFNIPLSRVYVYLSQIRLPKSYKRIVAGCRDGHPSLDRLRKL
jgi:hypothetical protein